MLNVFLIMSINLVCVCLVGMILMIIGVLVCNWNVFFIVFYYG